MPQLGTRISGDLDRELTARGDRNTVTRDTLERYFRLLREARLHLRRLLTPEEQAAICAVLQGTFIDDTLRFARIALEDGTTAPVLYAEVEDGLRYGEPALAAVDGPALLAKFAGLTEAQNLALLDAVERWRAGQGDARRLLEEV